MSSSTLFNGHQSVEESSTSISSTTPAAASQQNRTPTIANDETTLTPLRAHYLKKALVELQFEHELDAITSSSPANVSAVSFLGPPFAPPPKGTPRLDLPLLRFAFRECILTFPFLAAAPTSFFPDKLQPFLASVFSRGISADGMGTDVLDEEVDDPEAMDKAMRQKLRHKLERNLALLMGSAIKLQEKEDVVRLNQKDLDRLEDLARRRQRREKGDTFEINVVCIRTVVEKARIRSKAHEEFIIRTRRSGQEDVYVSRRHGDFATLAAELRKVHPNVDVPTPPKKDRTQVTSPTSPTAPFLARSNTSSSVTSQISTDSTGQPTARSIGRLTREKNRLTLRAYLHTLMASSTLASSPVLRSFLLAEPTTLDPEEKADARRREEADRLRDDGRKRFAKEIADRVEGLRGALRDVKGDMMGKDGLTHVFGTIKTVENVRDLPKNYQAVLEWARISLASTIFQNLIAADNASDIFHNVKRIHGLMPYFMLKTALRISNPVGMIRSVLDLFLAQPFGQRSLLQRMFSSSLQEEVKALEEDIENVEDKVEDPVIVEKVRKFVFATPQVHAAAKAEAKQENIHVLAVVLRNPEQPALNRQQMQRVIRSHRAHVVYRRQRARMHDSDDDDGPEDDDAWLFEDLAVLARLFGRLRDRKQLLELIFEGTTSDLLKDMITIFYSPLAQVYKAASIADSIGDLQNFITDLIRTVDQIDASVSEDPARTVKLIIDLVARHEQSFYSFVHKVHSKGESLFDGLMQWIEQFMSITRDGITPDPVPIEFLLPHAGAERAAILHEVDAVTLYHYKLKVAYEERLRKRFKAQSADRRGATEADAEDEATQALVNGVMDELSFGELMQGDALDTAAADSDYSDDDYSEDETESSEYETADEDAGAGAGAGNGVSRSRTITHPPNDGTIKQRNRSKSASGRSVRKARSMTFSGDRHSSKASAPPVPPVPQSAGVHGTFSRHGGANPITSSNSTGPPSKASGRMSLDVSRRSLGARPKKVAKKKEEIKPPELHHIPQLLPVFLELIWPGLQPRRQLQRAPTRTSTSSAR